MCIEITVTVNATCPEDYVKCPGSYCIAVSLFCDGVHDCPQGEDEFNCGMLVTLCIFAWVGVNHALL